MKSARIKRNINLMAFLAILFILAMARQGRAQGLEASTMVQQTVMGFQSGYSLEYRTAKSWGVGVFFQSTEHLSLERSAINYPFYGLDFSAPLTACGNVQVFGRLKTGLVNQNYLIATPEVETRIKLFDFLKLGVGAGYRSRQAAVSAKLTFNII